MDRFDRPGKVDRGKERQQTRYRRIGLEPTTDLERTIVSLSKQVDDYWRSIPYTDAVNFYLNARNLRHDLWLEFLEYNKAKPYYKFSDTRYSDFIEYLSKKLQIDIDYNKKLANKTPDILIYDDYSKCVFLGDISISVDKRSSEQRKYEKYLPIKLDLNRLGFRVNHTNFIIDTDLIGVDRLIHQFINLNLIRDNRDMLTRIKLYHETCNKIIRQCNNSNDDKRAYIQLLERIDKTAKSKIEDIEEADLMELVPDNPIRSEIEIINMIKEKTDKNLSSYFDNGYQDAEIKFKELYSKFEDREHAKPKSTLKVVHNSNNVEELVGHELIMSYVNDIHYGLDETVSNYVSNLLPTLEQLKLMKEDKTDKEKKVYGKWQYGQITNYHNNYLTMDYREKISRGKKNPNSKTNPTTIDPKNYESSISTIEGMIESLGSISTKKPFLDDTWDCKTTQEYDNTFEERKIYDYVRKTNGAQLGQSLSMLYQRLIHLKTSLSTKDNIFTPPNGSFICIIPRQHQPLTSGKCDVPLIFITRVKKGDFTPIYEYEYTFDSIYYSYYVSKLCRLSIDKISYWDQAGHKIVACSSYLLSACKALQKNMSRVVGSISLLCLDLHQKTSELLDLLKYVSFMPFSDISRISMLITDKFDIMLKTNLDVWVIKNIEDFMGRLAIKGNVVGSKEKLKMFNGTVLNSSLGMDITIPSFLNKFDKHDKIQYFIEEISMINIVRGKQFYGSQFMDKSISLTAEWNNDFLEEIDKYKGWTEGHDDSDFPFDAKFCFSNDAIIYAMNYCYKNEPLNANKVLSKLSNIDYDCFIHNICSLRGCTKEKEVRKNNVDLHTTSLDACLDYYKTIGYDTKEANTIRFSHKFLKDDYIAQYSMSEKEQRGGGRPIATPTLITKIGNLMIEKPEQAIGTFTPNNILVAGKHKLKTQSITYKNLLEEGTRRKLPFVFQCTEDQSKFSENDNTRKYYTYIRNNNYLPPNIRKLQYKCLEKMVNREHLTKRLPTKIMTDINLVKYVNNDNNGIRAIIGWPQGMLNNISTSIHSIADYWITYAFNKAYNTNIITKGLVHSDDSWYAIACNSLDEFKKFAVFRAYAKKMFCLKLNDKKLWGSRLLGELVSNFNINGEVLVPVGKTIANSFGSLLYQNWVIDVHTQISTLQQLYRQGSNIGMLTMMSTVLRQQIISAYNLTNKLNDYFYILPIEMGGYPDCAPFELGVTGINAHYKYIFDFCIKNPNHNITLAILRTMRLSMIYNKEKEDTAITKEVQYKCKTNLTHLFEDKTEYDQCDYDAVVIPKRGEVFSCIKHIMPKSKKISITFDKIRNLPFETDGLEMLVTRPKDLSTALGHLKSQMNTLLFSLASEKYTGNKRRLAINQSIQATGKTVQIAGFSPMNMTDMVETLMTLDGIMPATIEQLEISFEDDTNLVEMCNAIVYKSESTITNLDKKRIVNRMPDFEDKYRTVCQLRNVLLYIIDKARNTSYRMEHTQNIDDESIIKSDAELISRRFKQHFAYYNVEYACNLIMQQYFSRLQPRLWAQPELRIDDMQNFLEDLYGKTINSTVNYSIQIEYKSQIKNKDTSNVVQTLYTVSMLNSIYPDKFKIASISGIDPQLALRQIDYGTLSQSDYLKYGILCKMYLNNDAFLKDYDSKKVYSHYYTKPQKVVKGTYQGDFVCYIKYGNLVIKVEGEPCDLKITVNKPYIQEILNGMFLFVNSNFPEYSYNFSGGWYLNKFWRSTTWLTNMELISYGGNITMIKRISQHISGLALDINPNLRYPVREPEQEIIKFEIDETLRVVYKHTSKGRIRLDNVKQNMSCPLNTKVRLQDEFIDGFNNNYLLNSKIILNVTMQRSFNASMKEIEKLLKSRLPPINIKPVIISFCNICMSIDKNLYEEISSITENIEEEVFNIEGDLPTEFFERHKNTNPEDLNAIELDCLYDEETRIGAIIRHNSLLRLFCKYLTSPLSSEELKDFIWLLFKDKDFRDKIIEVIKDVKDESISFEDLINSCENTDIDVMMFSFVISNKLDMIETFKNLDFKKLIQQKERVISNIHVHSWYQSYIRQIKNALFEEDEDNDDEILSLIT
ncbi:MAG: RdRp [hymenopteran phasma-related virus OKIAV228]|uniref:RdRp n=1 Tax=hymenopteran phasma-related virus OKIAV228 TaxID=2847800 RepID=UPI00248425BF|nr:MAG: RdRp [hymenopteran phasma-related virus OKIAV228]WBM84619.1 MAG: RdRp [hymenopteran phasma-related virus OKIAV228]